MNRLFPVMLFVVSVLIAGTAAYFSVRGIGLLFAGSFLPVVVMASSLEIGKLFAVSFLYRKWYVMPKLLRFYLSVATLLLIVITSLGIFGFLSDAYQDTKNKVSYYDTKINTLMTQNESLTKQINDTKQNQQNQQTNSNSNVDRYKQIYDDFVAQQNKSKQDYLDQLQVLNDQVAALESKSGGLFSNTEKKLKELKEQQLPTRTKLQSQIDAIDEKIQLEYSKFLTKVDTSSADQQQEIDVSPMLKQIQTNNDEILELKSAVHDTDIGSFKFIAQAFDIQVDTAVKWFIMMIVVVFDPLAMCLIIGYNVYVHGRASAQSHNVIPTVTRNSGTIKITPIKK